VRADNSHHLRAAARRRALETRQRAVQALRRLDATSRPVTIEAVAREAGVSRSWLYGQPDLRAEIQRLRDHGPTRSSTPTPRVPTRQRASDASLRRRLEAVNAQIRRLRQENQQLRERLAWTLGELRTTGLHGQASHAAPSNHTRPQGSSTIGPCS
jgi:Family of unknown function (DUF6262)